VLAEDIISDMDMPPFDKSAMDGFACRFEDIGNELEVIETIVAGQIPQKPIGKNQCSKIMTGAMVPNGADCVLMVEHTIELGNKKIKYTKEINFRNLNELKDKRILNICYQAEDIKSGTVVIKKGKIIKAQHVAMMASAGYTEVNVYRQPKVAVIPTGNEIVEPGFKPSVSEIRNSNGYQLMAQLKNMGIHAFYNGIARDTESSTMQLIEDACKLNDVIILTGGVSKGDFDLIPEILKKLNFDLLFREIAVQPGKPTVFATRGNKYCFALPGNPVSCFVQFEVLVKPFLQKMMGDKCGQWIIPFPLASDYSRKKADRLAFIPVNINKNGEAELLDYHGSAHINGFVMAWGLMEIPIGLKSISKGEKVNVRPI
jgi:molybdopterin molybdotransferase